MQLKVPIEVKMDIDEIIARLKEDDVVQVVRCKDCMYHEDKEISENGICCLIGSVGWEDNDYCSKGDRKDNETD